MSKPSRALWLPAVAVLLPCAFIGLVGYKWLTLEREAAAGRSAAAAAAAVRQLRRDLGTSLGAVVAQVAAAVPDRPEETTAPYRMGPPPSPLVHHWFLFDASGGLVAPDPDGVIAKASQEYQAGLADADWEQARDRVALSDTAMLRAPTAASLEALLAVSGTASQRAASHLVIARALVAAGQLASADGHAREVGTCCPGTRDASGVSIPLIAAWLRAGLYARQRDGAHELTALASELQALAAQGYLGHADDLVTLGLVAELTGRPAVFANVSDTIERTRKEFDALRIESNQARRWIPAFEGSPEPGDGPALRALQSGSTRVIAARLPVVDGRQLVVTLDESQLVAWIAAWSPTHSEFDVQMVPREASGSTAAATPEIAAQAFRIPLASDPSLATLLLTHRRPSARADELRQGLFAAAIAAGVLLALALGFFAMRDVSRELRLASMRATFVASVTHELKTPLASIRLIAETFRQKRARPESADELMDTIVDETDRLTRLVDNVLSSSRIESGATRYASRVVPLAGVVRNALDRCDPVLRRDGFQIRATIDDDDVRVMADPDALGQSVINLLGNAAKYSGSSREIRVTVGPKDGAAEISVADDGIGIAPAEQSRVFERFYRASNAGKDTTGAGLGLALVQHFAEAHGGRVSVASVPGHGSVFTLRLPIQATEN